MTGVFLQVRLDSTRLPGKALLPLAGKPIVTRVLEALHKIPAEVHAVLTEEGSREALLPLAESQGFRLYVGPKEDVLKRYTGAARAYAVEWIVRATGDNPFVSWELAAELLKDCRRLDADYGGHYGMPLGCGVEILKAEALFRAERETQDPYDHEHVAPYLYKNPQIFFLHRPLADLRWRSNFRLTIDTREDYERVKVIYESLYRGQPSTMDELMEKLRGLEEGA